MGVTKITRENVDDMWRRIAIYQALFGGFLTGSDGAPLFFTKSDIDRHIGIETEGKSQTFEEFCRSIEERLLNTDEKLLPFFIANGRNTLLKLAGVGTSHKPKND